MNINVDIYSDGSKINGQKAVSPGSSLKIMVTSDSDLKSLKLEVKDTKGNTRFMTRKAGNRTEFETLFPPTRSYGDWSISVIGKTGEGSVESLESTLKVDIPESEKRQLGSSEVTVETSEEEAEAEPAPSREKDEMVAHEPQEEVTVDNTEASGTETDMFEQQIETEPLSTLSGVGKATENKLIASGITSIRELAESDVDAVVNAGIQVNQAEGIIAKANEYLNSQD